MKLHKCKAVRKRHIREARYFVNGSDRIQALLQMLAHGSASNQRRERKSPAVRPTKIIDRGRQRRVAQAPENPLAVDQFTSV
jgi:hypothetical protein